MRVIPLAVFIPQVLALCVHGGLQVVPPRAHVPLSRNVRGMTFSVCLIQIGGFCLHIEVS